MAVAGATDVVMPQMGVSVSEGTITKWLKQVGETINADESLLEISTDKVDTEVPSPATGVLAEILVQEGETVEVGTKLAVIAPEGAEVAPTPAPSDGGGDGEVPEPATAQAAAEVAAVSDTPATPPTAESVDEARPAPAAGSETTTDASGNGKSFVSPVVARIASEHNVDPGQVEGTGRGGRVTKQDILGFIERGGPAEAAPAAPATPEAPAAPTPPPAPEPAAPAPAPAAKAPAPAPAPAPVTAQVGEQLEPMSAMRRGIAEHMRRSLDTSHTSRARSRSTCRASSDPREAEEGAPARLRRQPDVPRVRRARRRRHAARVPVGERRDPRRPDRHTSVREPRLRGRARGRQGLIVPVLKHAETLNLLGIAKGVADIAQRARDKKLNPDEVQGGTFTITNPGGYGTFHGTPVISQPQAAILGTYALVKRPWVVQDELGNDVIAIRPIMNLTLTYDHRLIDGALAGRFLRDLRKKLESWGESDY
jgi:2-oxoglutarate dehydrogenase E2 component (dihydrolipoamide succinyltransferase)